jgi:hypothetical protein
MERKGASYKVTQKRPAQTHADHAQRTNATVASEMYQPGSFSYGPMDARAREYSQAEAGMLSKEQMSRVGIDHRKYPSTD